MAGRARGPTRMVPRRDLQARRAICNAARGTPANPRAVVAGPARAERLLSWPLAYVEPRHSLPHGCKIRQVLENLV